MNRAELSAIIDEGLGRLVINDRHLFLQDLSERCLASRLAHYVQQQLETWSVDVEYNRHDLERNPKRLGLHPDCANRRTMRGEAYVLPDLIIHQRGPRGPNLLAMELKKTTNQTSRACDVARIHAYRSQYGYQHGVLVELETRAARDPSANVTRWIGG